MKILVLQLARLGDIFQTWPALRALRRAHPDAQIDIMVRPKFAGAVEGLEAISSCIFLPTEEIIKPLIQDAPDLKNALQQISQTILQLKDQKYDQIINLSFSPVSSYLVHAVQGPKTEVSGYTRHADGFFDISGEVSTYFYAQVGVGRANRFHLTELMAGAMGVELTQEDWQPPTLPQRNMNLPNDYIVLHVGSSEAQKSLPAFRWARIVNYFQEKNPSFPVVLVGSKEESAMAELIHEHSPKTKVINLVGQTSITDLFSILTGSRLLVGCDSAPMHIAGFTKTPCLNLSLGSVNFWETGPRSPRSFILRGSTVDQILSEAVSSAMSEIIEGKDPINLIKCIPENPCYLKEESQEEKFGWELILALYMAQPFPRTENIDFFQGCQKLHQINEVILENLKVVSAQNLERLKPILDRSDEIIHKLAEIVPLLGIYSHWLKTERARVKPGSIDDTIQATRKMHQTLRSLIRPYILEDSALVEGGIHG